MKTKPAITFIAHGSPKQEANDFLKNLVAQLEDQGRITMGFLNFDTPDIKSALKTHIDAGEKTIHVIPIFLTPGKHVKEDIPEIIAAFQKEHAHVDIVIKDFVGNHPNFLEILKEC